MFRFMKCRQSFSCNDMVLIATYGNVWRVAIIECSYAATYETFLSLVEWLWKYKFEFPDVSFIPNELIRVSF